MPNLIIPPRDLPDATEVFPTDSLVVDNGATVSKATPLQIVDAGRAWATIQEAQEGTIANKSMSPLTTAAAITSQVLEQFGSEYVFADYAAALAGAPDLDPSVLVISADVGGVETRWIREAGGTALGGGWSAAVAPEARTFNGDLAAAHATGKPVDYGSVLWPNDEDTGYFNMYGGTKYRTASTERLQQGRNGSPVDDPQPITATVKFSSASRAVDTTAWDQTGYYGLVKKSGTAYGTALTGAARADGGDGDLIGVHARYSRYTAGGRGYALWAYFSGNVESTEAGHAGEINGYTTYDPGYGSAHELIRLCMADSSADVNRFGSAITIGRATLGGNNNGFHTAIHIEPNAMVRSTGADGEAVRIDAPITGDGSIGGVRFAKGDAGHLGVFKYALKTDEGTFSNSEAVILGNGQRVSWFSAGVRNASLVGGSTSLALSNALFNVANPVSGAALQAAGVTVVGTRKTGWAAPTGTATRTTFATSTVTTTQLAERVKGLIDDLIAHGLIGA